jgi:hypothetical protein
MTSEPTLAELLSQLKSAVGAGNHDRALELQRLILGRFRSSHRSSRISNVEVRALMEQLEQP